MEYIGGQALIEGVMILDKEKIGIAIRKGKRIITKTEERSKLASKMQPLLFIRGIASLAEMLYIGTKALIYSSEQAIGSKEKINTREIAFMIGLSLIIGLGLFVLVPFFVAKLLFQEGLLFNIAEGVVRIVIFFGYLLVISLFKDIQRVFQYHGAEHMTVHCLEAGKKLTPEEISKFPTAHLRCGTSFIVIVLTVAIFVFSLITSKSLLVKLLSRLLLIPVIAGVSYEILKLVARFSKHWWIRPLLWPGLFVQKITTKRPDRNQIEVAIAAVRACIKKY